MHERRTLKVLGWTCDSLDSLIGLMWQTLLLTHLHWQCITQDVSLLSKANQSNFPHTSRLEVEKVEEHAKKQKQREKNLCFYHCRPAVNMYCFYRACLCAIPILSKVKVIFKRKKELLSDVSEKDL